jgi:uroporphyrinogen-III synthase
LHYSRRSAALAVELAERAGVAEPFRALLHVCLSPDAAAPLRAWGAGRVVCASEPTEDRLIDALERALAAPSVGRRAADR